MFYFMDEIKTSKPVLEVFCTNHPGARPLTAGSFVAYGGQPPTSVQVDATDKTVACIS